MTHLKQNNGYQTFMKKQECDGIFGTQQTSNILSLERVLTKVNRLRVDILQTLKQIRVSTGLLQFFFRASL